MHSILIIDDDQAAQHVLGEVLREEGYQVLSADTGEKGLQLFHSQPFQAVLLDLRLPDADGLDILKGITESDSGQRVIIMSGYATRENAIKALNQGAYAYVTKPLNIEMLKASIKQAVLQHEMAVKKKEAEEEVRQLKEYTEKIVESLPYAIIIFDASRTVEYVNKVYLNDFNFQRKAVIGADLYDVLPFSGPQRELVKNDIEAFLADDSIELHEIDVDQRIFRYRIFYISRGGHESQRIGLIFRDVTNEKKMQQQLIQSEKLAGIGTMAMGIAHELNNPLFGIMGMAEAIVDEKEPGLIKEYATDIIKYAKAASAIVRGLTVYSRSTEAADLKNVNVNEQLDDAIKIVRHSLEFDDVEVIKDYRATKGVTINSGELQQVLVNIIHNAIQAMRGRGKLELSTESSEHSVVIKIRDSGPGIAKEHLGRIFDPFFTTKDPDEGTGLGLNITYRIVQKYNGTIGVESGKGQGATFIVTFPVGE